MGGSHLLLLLPLAYLLLFASSCAGNKADLVEEIMVESLRTNNILACLNPHHTQHVELRCPRNTHLRILNVFYGRLVPSSELCPTEDASLSEDTSCTSLEARERVLELCRNKRKCKLHVNSSTFGDPCPGTSKYLSLAYACKPVSFEDSNFCQNSEMKLACPHQKRLFVYSASFGRTVATQATHCSLRDPVAQDCVDDVLPAVLHSCHAQQSCKLPVDERFLGNPCGPSVSKYLSVISACVHETVFSEAAIKGELESMRLLDDELKDERAFSKPQEEESFSIAKVDSAASFELDGEDEAGDEKPAVQLMSKDGKSTISELRPEVQRGIEVGVSTHNFQSEPIEPKNEREETADEFVALSRFFSENKERTTLYLLLSAASGVILVLLVCACHQCRVAKNRKQPTNSQRSLLKSSHSVVEQGSLLSNHSPPIYLDAENPFNNYEDCSSPFSHRTSSQHYVRFQQPVVPPRTPLSLHYYS